MLGQKLFELNVRTKFFSDKSAWKGLFVSLLQRYAYRLYIWNFASIGCQVLAFELASKIVSGFWVIKVE
jgi:hypothetical protein